MNKHLELLTLSILCCFVLCLSLGSASTLASQNEIWTTEMAMTEDGNTEVTSEQQLAPSSPSPCSSFQDVVDAMWAADTAKLTVLYLQDSRPNSSVTLSWVEAQDPEWDIVMSPQEVVRMGETTDSSVLKLFQYVSESKLNTDIYRAFQNLLDNYDPDIRNEEIRSAQEELEVDEFLEVLLKTGPVLKLSNYLACKSEVLYPGVEFRQKLKTMWFQLYHKWAGDQYAGIENTCGFEEVFMGSFSSDGRTANIHNWLRLYYLEQTGDLEYIGYYGKDDPDIFGPVFTWAGRSSGDASMFVGTSPDLEIALYTLCALENSYYCNVVLGGRYVYITSFFVSEPLEYAYPDLRTLIPPTLPPTPKWECGTVSQVSELIWEADTSRLSFRDFTSTNLDTDIILHVNGKQLIQVVNVSKLESNAWLLFRNLLNIYDPEPARDDLITFEEDQKVMNFLKAVVVTGPMRELITFLKCRGLIQNQTELENTLYKMWFEGFYRYTEAFGLDSSGFENVFVGEFDLRSSTQVSGLHNWYRFYLLEQTGAANFTSYRGFAEPNILGLNFTWARHEENKGIMFIGSSPEFELAIYTLCYLVRPGPCQVSLKGHPVVIYTADHGGQLSTAYPDRNVSGSLPGLLATKTTAVIATGTLSSLPTKDISSTSLPSTNISSTSLPATNTSSTSLPTTNTSSTSLPTTDISNASLPTTFISSTPLPTTGISTASIPTTDIASTSLPTTDISSTSIPTTAIASTSLPTTFISSTSLQTTGISSTSIPTTDIASTSLPTTDISSISIPTTNIASTSLSTTAISSTSIPATDISGTSIATTDIASTSLLTTDISSASIPTTDISSASIATTDIASTSLPITDITSTSLSTTDIPSTSLPTTPISSTSIPTTDISGTSIATTDIASTSLLTTDISSTSLPTTDISSTSIPTTDIASTSLPTIEKTRGTENVTTNTNLKVTLRGKFRVTSYPWSDVLAETHNPQAIALARDLEKKLIQVYTILPGFTSIKIFHFSKGSVEVIYDLEFDENSLVTPLNVTLTMKAYLQMNKFQLEDEYTIDYNSVDHSALVNEETKKRALPYWGVAVIVCGGGLLILAVFVIVITRHRRPSVKNDEAGYDTDGLQYSRRWASGSNGDSSSPIQTDQQMLEVYKIPQQSTGVAVGDRYRHKVRSGPRTEESV